MTVKIALGFLGGLGLFIYGMRLSGEGLQLAAGGRLRRLLEILTTNPLLGVIVGAVTTALIQSSSATTVITVGFVNAGLMTLPQAAGVIMGANIGTTVTAQLIAFRLTDYALPVFALGMVMSLFSRKRPVKYFGQVVLGFGLLFLGMQTMINAMAPLREMPFFTDMHLLYGRHPFLGVLTGVGMTSLVQSSSATIGILQALASQGLLDIRVALPILFGDNIGTCVTALLSSIGTSVNARRAAMIHLLFNALGTIIFLLLLPLVVPILDRLSHDPVRQVAHAHTLFNVGNTLIQLPFVTFLALAARALIPGQDVLLERGPKFLEKRFLDSPAVALGQVRRELTRMGRLARETLADALAAFMKMDEKLIASAYEKEEIVNELERAVTVYLVDMSSRVLSEDQGDELNLMFNVVKDIERVGDHAENITELAEYKIEHNLSFSPQALDDLESMYVRVDTMFAQALDALRTNDLESAINIMKQEDAIDQIEKELRRAHIKRLNDGLCYPASGIVFLDIISNLERIGDHSSSIAHGLLEENDHP